jgi:hypothetical protein
VGAHYQPALGRAPTGNRDLQRLSRACERPLRGVALTARTEAVLTLGKCRFDYGTGNARTGNGLQAEVAYRWGQVEPQGNFYWYNSDTKKNSFLKVAGGLNFFLQGHRVKIQAKFASIIANARLNTTPAEHQVVVQTQLAF